jgi:SAM-dependent methyltransferase
MYLLRLVPLRHQPLPYTFAAVLAGFLLYWGLGAALSAAPRGPSLSLALRLAALSLAATIPVMLLAPATPISGAPALFTFVVLGLPYFVPCVFFGYLFGRVTARAARSWGRDVGRIYVLNTAGSCLGVLAVTLVGYEMPFYLLALILALLLYALQEHTEAAEGGAPPRRVPRAAYPLAAGVLLALAGVTADLSGVALGMRLFYGRDGVIGIGPRGELMWDGLWHSQLSDGESHIGTQNWLLAVCPALAHARGEIEDVCVIGAAAGITAATLAKHGGVTAVDAYEINEALAEVYERYPTGTLGFATHPKIHLIWQDARSGLALSPKRYDLIVSQPLYLKQAGSGLLNSEEFFRLVSRRLKPGGIFGLYSNGTAEQALVIRETAARVFPYGESFLGGYLLVLSNDPLDLSAAALARRLGAADPLTAEIRAYPGTRDAAAVRALVDTPRLPWGDGRLVSTDDHPIIEYPDYLKREAKAQGFTGLPAPGVIPE